MKVAAMTVLCVDFYEKQNLVCVGGNSVNFATQCMKSGAEKASLIGAVGTDTYGKAIIDYIDKRGIDRSHVIIKNGKTASNRILINENGDRFFPQDAWNGGVYQDFILSEEDWIFVLSHDIIAIPANNINYHETLKRVTPSNLLACDFLDMRDFDLMNETIPLMQLAFISGDDEVCTRMHSVSKKCTTLITVTLGADGSRSFLKGMEYFIKAVEVKNITDTTGCGDAYQAAFSVSYLKERNIEKAMQSGSIAAAEILTHMGGVKE